MMTHPDPELDPETQLAGRWPVLLISDARALFDALCQPAAAQGMALSRTMLTGAHPADARPMNPCAVVVDAREKPRLGLQVIASFRQAAPDLPLLGLLSAAELDTVLACLAAGANDFVGHHDLVNELIVRLCMQRQVASVPERLVAGDLTLAPATRQAWKGARPLSLSARQFDLLHLLMRHAGHVVSRSEMQASIVIDGGRLASNLMEVHVHHLRRRIGADRLLTIRGRGYRLLP
jgi:two-component system OmpR family response regulator/two-component system response regulator QseB